MDRPRRTGGVRSRYVKQACGVCRYRKARCTGERPICHTCEASGHASDCSWAPGSVKPRNGKAHVEFLRNEIAKRDNYISLLEAKLELCRTEHAQGSGTVEDDYLYVRPDLASMDDEESDSDLLFSDNEDELVDSLRVFQLGDRDLQWYGKVSVFQYAPAVPGNASRFPAIVEDASRCYVLMVDGVEESNCNPDFDWSRHLPPEVHLDRRHHDKLLDLLFKFFTSWCLRIVPALFLRDMYRALHLPASQTPPKTAHYSPMLHNALLALATAFSDDPQIRDLRSRRLFINKAKGYIDSECQSPNTSVVQALSIIGSFHSSMGEQTLGYLYFGLSGRLSQALGLSIDCSPWVKANYISHDDMLDRNWGYWTTFAQDVCWSLYVGREFCMASPSDQMVIPIPFVDSSFDQIPWYHPPSGLPPQPNYLSSTFAATCKLLRIGRRIMEVVNVLSNPGTNRKVSPENILELDNQLKAWKDGLPPEVELEPSNRHTATPHRIMLQMAFWWLYILLHRPFYRRTRPMSNSEKELDHIERCDTAAGNIMELVGSWRMLYSLRYVPITFIQVVFSAGTVFLLSAVQAATTNSSCGPGETLSRPTDLSFSHSLAKAELCIEYLLETGRSFQCANHIAGILRNLLHGELKTRLLDRMAAGATLATSSSSSSSSSGAFGVKPINNHDSSDATALAVPSHYFAWDPSRTTQYSSRSWDNAIRSHDNNGSLAGPSEFRAGPGMRGGETLSNQPFDPNLFGPDQLGSQLGALPDEQVYQEPFVLTEKDMAILIEALSQGVSHPLSMV